MRYGSLMVMGPGIVIPHSAGYVSRLLMRLLVVPALSLEPNSRSKPVCMMILLACDRMGIISLFFSDTSLSLYLLYV